MGKVFYMEQGDVHTEPVSVPVGTVWLFTSNGSFEAPADGNYQIEMHGGGGGGAYFVWGTTDASEETVAAVAGGGGGGSGEIKTVTLAKGDVNAITIGAGGVAGTGLWDDAGAGGATTFGSLSVAGGGAAIKGWVDWDYHRNSTGGSASGSIATAGAGCAYALEKATWPGGSGGLGNSSNPAQPYGNGGVGATCKYNYAGSVVISSAAQAGKAGAVIITYLGKG